MHGGVDILMVTFNRPEYVQISLPHLLSTCGDDARVWLWHNGEDRQTLDLVRRFQDHPKVHRFHHSPHNVKLHVPTNWMWSESTGDYLAKIDDDCLPGAGWLTTLREAHDATTGLGAIACWHFQPEDVDEEAVQAKIMTLPGGHRVMRNHWVQGSGYLTKRNVAQRVGPVTEQGFTSWCLRAARLGYVNGWYYPFVPEDHMDDPRSPHNIYRSDADFMTRRPLSAKATGVTTIAEWEEQMRRSARVVQRASLDLSEHIGWRRRRRNLTRKVRRAVFGKAPW